MTALHIVLDGDRAFPEATPESFGVATAMARLPGGMASGKSSVCIELTLPDGRKAYGQTSLDMLQLAVRAFAAREEADAAASGRLSH